MKVTGVVTDQLVIDAAIRALCCEFCKKKATCIGRYEDMVGDSPACDDCCGHGCEDGHCDPIYYEDGSITEEIRELYVGVTL